MSDLTTITESLRWSVSAKDAAEALGLKVDRSGRCACPIHNGRDRNCKVYADERGFYCHVCHTGGDVIRLVELVRSCKFWAAVEWLNGAFHCGLDLSHRSDGKRSRGADIALKLKREKIEQDKDIDRMLFECYVMACQLYEELERTADENRPNHPYREWPAEYRKAIRLIPIASDLVTRLALEVDVYGIGVSTANDRSNKCRKFEDRKK